MSDPSFSRRVRVANAQGLHLRPAHAFASLANRFQAKVRIGKDGEVVDGKSILSLIALMAPQGTVLEIETSGPQAAEALRALAELLETQHFDESGQESPFRE